MRIVVHDAMPGSAPALVQLDAQIAALPEQQATPVLVDEAWMLRARPGLILIAQKNDLNLQVEPRWCRLDAALGSVWHELSAELARSEAQRLGLDLAIRSDAQFGAVVGVELGAEVGLAVETRTRAALLAKLDAQSLRTMAEALLPALHPFALGLDASASLAARALLRLACESHGLALLPSFPFKKTIELPRRVKILQLGSEDFHFSWSRAQGTRWRLAGERSAEDVLALEVQQDLGGRAGYVAGLPARPRRYLASHFRPVQKAQEGSRSWLALEREMRIPEDPAKPHGRKRSHDARLEVCVDVEHRSIDFTLRLAGLLPRHRYRLCVPLPFWPRPARFGSAGVAQEQTGPFAAMPIDGGIDFEHKGRQFVLEGRGLNAAGIVEAELFERRNDLVCAITLARVPDEAACELVLERSFRLHCPE